jgi:hypothetical protein
VVGQLAGHSDIKKTRQYYFAVRLEDLQSANRLLNSILAEAEEGWHQRYDIMIICQNNLYSWTFSLSSVLPLQNNR